MKERRIRFAGAISDVDDEGTATGDLRLPEAELLPALVSFNLGIELAQLVIIAAVFLTVAMWRRDKPWYRRRFVLPDSAAIAATALFWTVQRIVA